MPTPYDRYIRFLATKSIDDICEINCALKEMGLPEAEQKDLDIQWALIHKTCPLNVINQIERKSYSADFMKNMSVLEVDELWLLEPPFDKRDDRAKDISKHLRSAYKIHEDSWLRVNINALLMKKVSLEEISRILSSKFSMTLTERCLAMYERYFFDVSMMTRALWKRYIGKYSGREHQIYFVALTESADILKTELELPAVVSVSDNLQWLLTKSILKAKTFINMNTVESGREARAWIEQVVQLTDKYEKHRSGDQHDFAKSLQMEFDFVDEDFASPDDEMAQELAEKTRPKETQ